MPMENFFQELKKRNVIRVVTAYLVGAWLLAQVAELVLDSFAAPPWIIQTILLLLAFGLPVAVILAWVFELTPEGIVKEEDLDRGDTPRSGTKGRLTIFILGALAAAIAFFIIDQISEPVEKSQQASIAVLPFTNRSAADDVQYFVDGVHDDLLTQLARLEFLKVISRTSVLEYRDTTKNMRQIGAELGVKTLLEGAVQRAGNRVRITAQLIDAESDEHLWAQSFDRELSPTNVLQIQSEIAAAIANQLSNQFYESGGSTALDRALTTNQEAYDLYLQSRAIPIDGATEDLWTGIDMAKRAVELDPQFALAMGQIAAHYVNIYWFTTQQPEHRDAARLWIDRALAIAPDDPRLRLTLAELLYTGYLDYDAALAALDRAQEGMPGDSSIYLNRGAILRRSGDFDGAIKAFEKAQLLNPRDVFSSAHHIFTFLYKGDVTGARRQAGRVLGLPAATSVHVGFTKLIDLFMLGDTGPISKLISENPNIDLGPEDQLKVFVPFLEHRYEDALAALERLPNPVVEQTNLWTHSFVRARVLHAQGKLPAARKAAELAIAELNLIASMMADNPRPVTARALMQALLGNEDKVREDLGIVAEIYPVSRDILDGPSYMADGLRALAIVANTDELVRAMDEYLSLEAKAYYVDYMLLDPAFDRHRANPAIVELQRRYSLRNTSQ